MLPNIVQYNGIIILYLRVEAMKISLQTSVKFLADEADYKLSLAF